MDAFAAALKITLAYEVGPVPGPYGGGYSNDPDDPGGATNYGITQSVYNDHRKTSGLAPQSVKFISQPEVQNIYRNGYWRPAGCDMLPAVLAIVVFDTAVNFGVGRAKQFLANATSGTPVDRAQSVVKQRVAYHYKRVAVAPSSLKFLKGWLIRDKGVLGKAQAAVS